MNVRPTTWVRDRPVYVNEDGYADDDDVLLWLLRRQAPLDLVRVALGVAYPDFDLDAFLNHVTMPDRQERRAEDRRRRDEAKAHWRETRDTTS